MAGASTYNSPLAKKERGVPEKTILESRGAGAEADLPSARSFRGWEGKLSPPALQAALASQVPRGPFPGIFIVTGLIWHLKSRF